MTTLPTWAVYAVSLGSPALAFVGVLVGQIVLRRSATELEVRSRREEMMRTLRWAAELGISGDSRKERLGFKHIAALDQSDLLQATEKLFVDAALESMMRPGIDDLTLLGDSYTVRRPDREVRGRPVSELPSDGEASREEDRADD